MHDHALLDGILKRSAETADLDFKSAFNTAQPGDWLEIIKDIIAFSNSGGGTILIGLNNDGSPSGTDVTGILSVDPADLTNRINKYTGVQFHGFGLSECHKAGCKVCAISIRGCRIPIIFTKVGTYEVSAGKQKAVFSAGTVYFRHGAKSEPGTSDDLRAFLEREVDAIKHSWLDGIAKLVEAPTGSRFTILPPETQQISSSGVLPLRLTDDPNAPAYYAVPIDTTHPFRQKEVVREVNVKLAGRKVVNTHDILCIRRVYNIQKDITFCYTQNYVSPRYSEAFVDWIVKKYDEDDEFFEKTKVQFDKLKTATA
jgi:hypothetical protein